MTTPKVANLARFSLSALCILLIFYLATAAAPAQAGSSSPGFSATEMELGKGIAVRIQSTRRMAQDDVVLNYVNGLAAKLAQGCNSRPNMKVSVIDSPLVEAIAVPGGPLFISSGLIAFTRDESELAVLMAHQIAHICAHQFIRGTPEDDLQHLLHPDPIPYAQLSSYFGPIIPDSSIPALCQSFPQSFEPEADSVALKMLYKAGYDPTDMLKALQRLSESATSHPELLDQDFSGHLLTPARTAALRPEIAKLPPRDTFEVNTSDFDVMRHRTEVLMPSVCSQQSRNLQGRVVDPAGAALPGATIKATPVGTHAFYDARSDSEGRYCLPRLLPGDYHLDIASRGFQPKTIAVTVGNGYGSITPRVDHLFIREDGHLEVTEPAKH